MKRLATISLTALISVALITTAVNRVFVSGSKYYVSTSATGSGNGLSAGSPWTWAQLNAASLSAGDTVLLKRGDVFYGALTVRSGASGNPVVYTAYSAGANPVISGFQTLTSWTDEGGGVYSAPLTASTVRSVLFNGYMKGMGRYPNSGYITITGATSSSSFSASSLTGTWTGATAVLRKQRYTFEMRSITGQAGTTLTTAAFSGTPSVNWGFFIQNSLATLDQLGEWYFASNKLYVYFGGGSPSAYTVEASNVDNLVNLTSKSNVQFISVDIEGANTYGVNVASSTNCSLTNGTILYSGIAAVSGSGSNGFSLVNETIRLANSNSVDLSGTNNTATISGCTIDSTGMIPGAGQSGGSHLIGIYTNGTGNVITGNTITNSGYNGTITKGNNLTLQNNLIKDFCKILDDGAGIYRQSGDSSVLSTNILIDHNLVIGNGSTAYVGTSSTTASQHGIYMDDNSTGATITGNTVSGCAAAGLYIHNSNRNTITDNIFYDNAYQVIFKKRDPLCEAGVYNNLFEHNQLFSKKSTQPIAQFWTYTGSIADFGTFRNNYYSRPTNETAGIQVYVSTISGSCGASPSLASTTQSNYTLSGFKSAYPTMEVGSTGTPSGVSTLATDVFFAYNASAVSITSTASWYFKDIAGTQYSPSFSLPAWTGVLGMKLSTQPVPVAGNRAWYYSNLGSDSWAGTIAAPKATFAAAYAAASPGDSVLGRGGDVFTVNSYIAKDSVLISSYGSGKATLIGYKTYNTFTGAGTNKYSFTDAALPGFVNVIWDNTGFLEFGSNTSTFQPFTSHSGRDWIAGTGLSGSHAGERIVLKLRNWANGIAHVASQSGDTLRIAQAGLQKPTMVIPYDPIDQYGFRLFNSLNYLTADRKYHFDSSNKRVTFYKSGSVPVINVATQSSAFNIDASRVTVENLNIIGYYHCPIIGAGNYNTIRNVSFQYFGNAAIYLINRVGWNITGNTFSDGRSDAVKCITDGVGNNSFAVEDNTFERIGLSHLYGYNGDPQFVAIVLEGNDNSVRRNRILNTGYNGIYFKGGGNYIEYNNIDSTNLLAGDGAGIYTIGPTAGAFANEDTSYVRYNTVLHTPGSSDGVYPGTWDVSNANGKGASVYADEYKQNLVISDNNLGYASWAGVMLHNTRNVTVTNNNIFNPWRGVYYRNFQTDVTKLATGNVIKYNTISQDAYTNSNTHAPANAFIEFSTDLANSSVIPDIDSNTYVTFNSPTATSNFVTLWGAGNYSLKNFTDWKTLVGKDAASTVTQKTSHAFFVNTQTESISQDFGGYTDLSGVTLTGLLPAYSSRIGWDYVPIITPLPSTRKKLVSGGKTLTSSGKVLVY